MIDSSYLTIVRSAIIEQRIKKSRFIGIIKRFKSEKEFSESIKRLRSEYGDATHHCHAYRIFDGRTVVESAGDDGEPAGSAGLPALRILAGRDLIDVGVTIIRYFGGTKLGIGGLMRAYGSTVLLTVEKAGIRTCRSKSSAVIMFPPSAFGAINALIEKYEIERIETGYGSTYTLRIKIPVDSAGVFEEAFANVTSGAGVVRYEH